MCRLTTRMILRCFLQYGAPREPDRRHQQHRKKIARLSKRQRRTLKRHELRLAAAPKANIHCGRRIHSVAVIGKDLVITGHCKLTRQHELALATLTGAPLPKCFKFMAFWRKRLSND